MKSLLIFLLLSISTSTFAQNDGFIRVYTNPAPEFNCDCYKVLKAVHVFVGDNGTRLTLQQEMPYFQSYYAPNTILTGGEPGKWIITHYYYVYKRGVGRDNVIWQGWNRQVIKS